MAKDFRDSEFVADGSVSNDQVVGVRSVADLIATIDHTVSQLRSGELTGSEFRRLARARRRESAA
jgi:hypothetical protein